MSGHLFITHGDLLNLSCDAILLPNSIGKIDESGKLVGTWADIRLPAASKDHLKASLGKQERVVRIRKAQPHKPAVWVVWSGQDNQDADWYATAIQQFIKLAHERTESPVFRPLGDARLLLGVPLLGASSGGMSRAKGESVKAAVQAILEQVKSLDIDVALVLSNDASYSAAQASRNRYQPQRSELSPALRGHVDQLAAQARSERLVLFLGAGVSMGAGLPSWSAMLEQLAESAGLNKTQRKELSHLDPRDAGTVLTQQLGPDVLRESIKEMTKGDYVSLMHQLLASLPVHEALTTNYDTLFEKAWRAAGHKPSVLPKNRQVTGKEWLVKLHGSVDDSARPLVLSRNDYLRFEGSSSALAGMVHAMLLTRHLLFVGYSLSDDNFYRIVHQVHQTVNEANTPDGQRTRFGTVLTDQKPMLVHKIWDEDVEFVSTASGKKTSSIRRMAILLDHLAASTAGNAEHLMNPSFTTVFTDDERELQTKLKAVRTAASKPKVRPGIKRAVDEALKRFGAPSNHQ